MRLLPLACLAACAIIRTGTTRQLEDGRTVKVTVIHEAGDYAPCAHYVRDPAGDEIVLNDEEHHCPSLSKMLAHELGHANGHLHEEGGVMMPIPFELFIQR